MKTGYLFLADGFEEMEAVATVDVLRRGGAEVRTVSIYDRKEVKGAHGMMVVADVVLGEAKDADYLIFPGGMPGAANLAACNTLMDMLSRHYETGKPVAAICAAPALVLGKLPLRKGTRMTCYPGFESQLQDVEVRHEGVVTDGQVITAQGPAYAVDFGLALLKCMNESDRVAKEVAAGMLIKK